MQCWKMEFPPPPAVSSAIFASTGATALVDLDVASDQAGMSAGVYFKCSDILNFADIGDASCFWVNSTQLSADVNAVEGFVPGADLLLREDTVRLRCEAGARCDCYRSNNASNVSVAPPLEHVVPRAVLQGPERAAVCEPAGVTIAYSQSTGAGGRDWSGIVWNVTLTTAEDANATAAQIDAALDARAGLLARVNADNADETDFVAERAELEAFTVGGFDALTLTLSLTNFLGGFSTSDPYGVALSSESLPSVTIIGGNKQELSASMDLSVEASGSATSCDGRSAVDRKVSYVWSLQGYNAAGVLVDERHDNFAANPRFFKLLAYSLSPGKTFALGVVVMDVVGDTNSSAVAAISIRRGAVRALIEGGDRVVSTTEPVTVSATSSYDEDIRQDCGETEDKYAIECGTGEAVGLNFYWNCSVVSAVDGSTTAGCAAIEPLEDSESLSIASLPEGTYEFRVTVFSDGRIDDTSVTLTAVSAPLATVALTSFATKVNSAEKQTILGVVAPPESAYGLFNTTWSLISGAFSGDYDLRTASTTRVRYVGAVETAGGARYHDLVLSPNTLVAGGAYKFRLEAVSRVVSAGIEEITLGYSTVTVDVSSPPSAGVIVASPAVGIALETPFDLEAKYWVGDQLPVKYAFRTISGDVLRTPTANPKLLGTRLAATYRSASLARKRRRRLQLARRGTGRTLGQNTTLIVRAVDAVGAEGEAETSVYVKKSTLTGEALANNTANLLAEAFANDDLAAVCSAVTAASDAAANDTAILGSLISALSGATAAYADDDANVVEQIVGALVGPVQDPQALDGDACLSSLDLVKSLTTSLVSAGLGGGESTTADASADIVSSLLKSSLFTPPDEEADRNATRRALTYAAFDRVAIRVETECRLGCASPSNRTRSPRHSFRNIHAGNIPRNCSLSAQVAVEAALSARRRTLANGTAFGGGNGTVAPSPAPPAAAAASETLLAVADDLADAQLDTLVANEDAVGVSSDAYNSANAIASAATGESGTTIAFGPSLGLASSAGFAPEPGSVLAASLAEFTANPHAGDAGGAAATSNTVRFGLVADDAGGGTTRRRRRLFDKVERRRLLLINGTNGTANNASAVSPADTATNVTLAISGTRAAHETDRNATFFINVTCFCDIVENVTAKCPDNSTVETVCNGMPGDHALRCGAAETACSAWDTAESAWVVPDGCALRESGEGETSCKCGILPGGALDFSTKDEATDSTSAYTSTFTTVPDLARARMMLYSLSGIFAIVLALGLWGSWQDRRDHKRENNANLVLTGDLVIEESEDAELGEAALAAIKRRTEIIFLTSSWAHIWNVLKEAHPVLNIVWCHEDVSRFSRAWAFGFELLGFMVAIALEVQFSYPEVECGEFADRDACHELTTVFGNSLCEWSKCAEACSLVEVDNGHTPEHYLMLLVVMVLLLPIIASFNYAFEEYLIKPVPAALLCFDPQTFYHKRAANLRRSLRFSTMARASFKWGLRTTDEFQTESDPPDDGDGADSFQDLGVCIEREDAGDDLACAACGAADAALQCGRCLAVRYCNAACQGGHWVAHRRICAPALPPTPANNVVDLDDVKLAGDRGGAPAAPETSGGIEHRGRRIRRRRRPEPTAFAGPPPTFDAPDVDVEEAERSRRRRRRKKRSRSRSGSRAADVVDAAHEPPPEYDCDVGSAIHEGPGMEAGPETDDGLRSGPGREEAQKGDAPPTYACCGAPTVRLGKPDPQHTTLIASEDDMFSGGADDTADMPEVWEQGPTPAESAALCGISFTFDGDDFSDAPKKLDAPLTDSSNDDDLAVHDDAKAVARDTSSGGAPLVDPVRRKIEANLALEPTAGSTAADVVSLTTSTELVVDSPPSLQPGLFWQATKRLRVALGGRPRVGVDTPRIPTPPSPATAASAPAALSTQKSLQEIFSEDAFSGELVVQPRPTDSIAGAILSCADVNLKFDTWFEVQCDAASCGLQHDDVGDFFVETAAESEEEVASDVDGSEKEEEEEEDGEAPWQQIAKNIARTNQRRHREGGFVDDRAGALAVEERGPLGATSPPTLKKLLMYRNEISSSATHVKQLTRNLTQWNLNSVRALSSQSVSSRNLASKMKRLEARTIAPIICDAVLLRREELAFRIRALTGRKDAACRRSKRLLELLEVDLLGKWQWSPNARVFQRNVEEITRTHLKIAARWHEELQEITGPNKRVMLERRVAKLVEYERASLMTPVSAFIYNSSLDRHCKVDGGGEPVSAMAYVLAWTVALIACGLQVFYLLQTATVMGNGKTRVWISQTAVCAVLFYAIITPLSIIFFFVFFPSLLREHMTKLSDPTALKSYPYRTKLPASPAFYVCQRNPELQSTRIAQRTLGSDNADGEDDEAIVAALGDIYHDTTWVPSSTARLSLFFVAFFVAIPEVCQEVVFEEIFTITPLLSNVVFSAAFVPKSLNADNRKGMMSEVFLLLSIVILLTVIYCVAKALNRGADALLAIAKLRFKSFRHWFFHLD